MSVPDQQSLMFRNRIVPLAMALISIVFTWFLVQFGNFPPTVQTLLFGLLCLATLLRQRWVIYGAVSVALFGLVGEWRGEASHRIVTPDFAFVIALMGYTFFSLRFTDLPFRIRLTLQADPADESDDPDARTTWNGLRPFTAGLASIPLAIGMAVAVLVVIPFDPATDYRFGILPNGFRAIAVLWFLAVIWFIGSGLFRLMAERDQDARRARVYARSQVCRFLKWELHAIEKRRHKKKTRSETSTS